MRKLAFKSDILPILAAVGLSVLIFIGIVGTIGCGGFPGRPPVAVRPFEDRTFVSGIVKIGNDEGNGTAFVIGLREDVIILGTAAHVAAEPTLTIGGLPVSVVGVNTDLDLAVVSVPRPVNASIFVFQIVPAKVLEPCLTSGYPGGVLAGDTLLRMPGHVTGGDAERIVVNSGIQPGMSGGPITDANGDVIGVVSHIASFNGYLNPTILVAGRATELTNLMK